MLGTLRAFAYLTWHTQRNRTVTRLRRAKNPRYAISAIIGVVYFWFFLVHNTGQIPRSIGGFYTDMWVVGATLGLVIFAANWWVFGGDQTTLAFSLAETSFLFPAPLSRRAIIGYKLFRAQLAIMINAVIFIFLMRRGVGYLPSGYRAVSLWVLFTTMNFHRVGAALVRASWLEHQRHGFRRNALPTAVIATLVLGVVVGGTDAWPTIMSVFHDKNLGAMRVVSAIRHAMESAPASIVLWPVHAIVAPVFAMTPADWAAALPAAFLVLLLHAWWVVRTDAAFEEAAIAASHERVRRIDAYRSRRMLAPKPEGVSRRGIRLPSWGHPAIAIVWKNILCLRRTMQFRVFIAPLIMAIVWGVAFGHDEGPAAQIGIGAITLAALLTFFGPMLMRNDLRQDMQNLIALKTLPLRGRTIVMAEVMSAALPVAIVQYGMLIIAGVSAQFTDEPLSIGLIVGVFAVALPALLAFAAAMVSIQNGAPVMFPGWVHIGTRAEGGIENLGQGVVSMGIVLILMLLMLIPAGGLAALAVLVLRSFGDALAVVAAIVLGTVTLSVETYGVFMLLGRTLERTEPADGALAA